MSKMKDVDFIRQALKALGSHTVYATGAFGASIGNFPTQKQRYYENTLKRCGSTAAKKVLTEASKAPCFAFDCVGLAKSLLWSWDAKADDIYGGAVYESNGVPDAGAGSGGLISYCTDVTTNFSNIVPGELLWIDGHVGIYIGSGTAVECTTAWTGNVLKSAVLNVRSAKSGEYSRSWTKHGKLPWIQYGEPPKPEIVCPCCGARFIKE